VRLVVVLLDCQWLFLVAAMSGVGLFISEIAYAFCVLDVIPQVICLMMRWLEAGVYRVKRV
jgi:hypothetical protein